MLGSNLSEEIIAWVARSEQLLVVFVVVTFLASSIAVVYSSHMTRQMYGSLQTLQHSQDDLDSEYEKLLLEQSAWAGYTRVDKLAREKLNMAAPPADELVVVKAGHNYLTGGR
jgi:cell division protein FtsL